MTSETERVPVVTSLLYSDDKIGLMKRSASVRTHRGLWGGFSGYMENLPLEQARIEIQEESGFSCDDVKLKGIGVPVEVDDIEENQKWLVYPFLFELKSSNAVSTNWEADEFKWFTPDQISTLETVPALDKAIRRVWPPFGDDYFWSGLSKIATDRRTGATSLARHGLEALGGFVQSSWDTIDNETLLKAIRAFAASRPSMGVFPNLAARLLLAIEEEGGEIDLDALITELLGAMNDAMDLSVSSAADALKNTKRIFTLSYSESVRDAIMAWQHTECTVVVAESAPGLEGLALGDYLSEQGISVEAVPDSEIVPAVRRSDAVLVGCDAITEKDWLINKVGTRLAVRTARDAGIPAYSIAQTFKITPPGWPMTIEVSPAAEGEGERHRVEPMFDSTPLTLFESVFTEEGTLSESRLTEIRSELGSVQLIPE